MLTTICGAMFVVIIIQLRTIRNLPSAWCTCMDSLCASRWAGKSHVRFPYIAIGFPSNSPTSGCFISLWMGVGVGVNMNNAFQRQVEMISIHMHSDNGIHFLVQCIQCVHLLFCVLAFT